MPYFDHNATSPLDPRVEEAMRAVARGAPGNPDSPHAAGRAARARLEDAREVVAAVLGARPAELTFTSGGTESNHLAILGALARRPEGALLLSAVEHASVREIPSLLASSRAWGVIPVDSEGLPVVSEFRRLLAAPTALVSVMLANNETGALLPVAALAREAKRRGALFHTDAVQALGRVPVRVADLGVDLLSGSAHKAGGPAGIGFLWRRAGIEVAPLFAGGHQERSMRPGTTPVALACGLAAALALSAEEMEARASRLRGLTGRLFARLAALLPGVVRNGPCDARLPNTLNFSVPGVSGEALAIALDTAGFCVSTGAACASGAAEPSRVLRAMGRPEAVVAGALRVSLGPDARDDDVEAFPEAVAAAAARLRGSA